MSDIYLYAEILAHIGQVSLYASLQTAKNDETSINISSDRRMITVTHDGDRATMFLPTGIGGSAEVTIPAEKKLDLSLRLELEDLAGLPCLDELQSQNEYPWLAGDLQVETSISCKGCGLVIIEPGEITMWKDLPSDDWAEMMDLWHCHKPQDEHTDSSSAKTASGKGYASSSHISAARHTGLLDVSSFLFDSQDCHNIQLRSETVRGDQRALHCTQCDCFLGIADQIALRRYVLHSGPSGTAGSFLLWVFNPALLYSSSRSTPMPHIGMKIFYQSVDDPQKLLDEQRNSVDELYLPTSVLQEFMIELKQSTMNLPQSARDFKEWTVGLLERYRREPMSMADMEAQFKPLFTSPNKDNENEKFTSLFTKEIEAHLKPLYT